MDQAGSHLGLAARRHRPSSRRAGRPRWEHRPVTTEPCAQRRTRSRSVRKRDPANFLRRLRPATEPGNLRQALDGIRLLGWRKSLQVARSTATHGYWDWRYAPPEPDWERAGTPPGRLLARDACP